MSFSTILLSKDGAIATVTLNQPENLNAYSGEMGGELYAAWQDVNSDPQIRVMIITGAGRAFCAGANVKLFKEAAEHRRKTGERRPVQDNWFPEHGPQFLARMDKITIAAINGPAVGIGFTLPLACDIRLMADTATTGAVFGRVGLIPEFGSTYLLPRVVGLPKALELVFTARIIKAEEAKEIGLVHKVVPAEQLMNEARSWATSIAANAPLTLKLGKHGLYRSLDATLQEQCDWENIAQDFMMGTADHLEGVTAFLEKRAPRWTGK